MKRITPSDIYAGMPCSMVAVGTAMNLTLGDAVWALKPSELHEDGYLSLDAMNRLIRACMSVSKREYYRRGERPALRDFAHAHLGQRAVICVAGHYIYFDGRDYHSFFWNGGDPVISVWYLE